MSGGITCPVCGNPNQLGASNCWVCSAVLSGEAVDSVLSPHDSQAQSLRVLGWTAFLFGLALVTLLVGVELALEWPGLLIPFALIVLVSFVALARTAYVHLQRPPKAPAPVKASGDDTGSPRRGAVTRTDVVQGVAMGLSIAMAVIAGLLLLFVAAFVIFALICFAMLSSSIH